MADTTPKTIVLKGREHHDEGIAASAGILPGQAVVTQASGGTFERNAYGLAGAASAGLCIVKEDALQGKTVLDAYAISDPLLLYRPVAGDEFYVLVLSGETVTIAAAGAKAANGKFDVGAGPIEFLEDSGGALAADTLVKARML